MSYEAVPLTERIGTEVRVHVEDLLTPAVAAQLRELLVARGVLVFRQLGLDQEQQLTLSRLMGTLREEGENGVIKITLDKSVNSRADYLKGSFNWHLDGTHDDVPSFASLLTAVKLSDVGGQTEFANTYAAYEELPAEKRERISTLRAVHSVEVSTRKGGVEPTPENLAFWRSIPERSHNLVWNHRNGRKSLVIGSHAARIEGVDEAEGQALLDELLAWTTQPQFVYRHDWTPGDLVIWDNTGVLHRVEPYPLESGRLMRRTTLKGEEPFA
jgi:alpha-ketoglutarate-dependent taurine dioxygenase